MPRPAVNLSPDTRTTEEICLASRRGLARQLTLTTVEIRSMRLVRAAAAASAMSGSRLSYTRRSITPTDSKPACSAWATKDFICAISAPGTAAGSLIPILMVPIFGDSLRRVSNETDGGAALGRRLPAGSGQPPPGGSLLTRLERQILKHAIMTLG